VFILIHSFFRWKIDKKEIEQEKHLQSILKQQYQDLNSLSWQEIIITCLFIILILLWVIRDFSDDRWLIIFKKEFVRINKISIENMDLIFYLVMQLMEQLLCLLVHWHWFYRIKIHFKVLFFFSFG